MKRIVRVGRIKDQDRFRRDDMAALTPEARIDCLLQLRQQQFGARAKRIRGSGIVTCRVLDTVLEGTH